MRYLEKELQYMNENLVQENFNRLAFFLNIGSLEMSYLGEKKEKVV